MHIRMSYSYFPFIKEKCFTFIKIIFNRKRISILYFIIYASVILYIKNCFRLIDIETQIRAKTNK